MRRRRTTPTRPRGPVVTDATCQDCHRTFRYFSTVPERCAHCRLVAEGVTPKGTMPNGSTPWLLDGPPVRQQCTGVACQLFSEHGRYFSLADLDDAGHCEFCRAPGILVEGVRKDVVKLHEGTLRFYGYDVPLVVPVTEGMHIMVEVMDQGRGYLGPKVVAFDARPSWGTGWTVTDINGVDRTFRSDWDSSG